MFQGSAMPLLLHKCIAQFDSDGRVFCASEVSVMLLLCYSIPCMQTYVVRFM